MSHISTPATSTTFANIGNLSSHNIGKARYSYYSLDKMAQKHINYEVLIIYVLQPSMTPLMPSQSAQSNLHMEPSYKLQNT